MDECFKMGTDHERPSIPLLQLRTITNARRRPPPDEAISHYFLIWTIRTTFLTAVYPAITRARLVEGYDPSYETHFLALL